MHIIPQYEKYRSSVFGDSAAIERGATDALPVPLARRLLCSRR
jgi:hypothetical protein